MAANAASAQRWRSARPGSDCRKRGRRVVSRKRCQSGAASPRARGLGGRRAGRAPSRPPLGLRLGRARPTRRGRAREARASASTSPVGGAGGDAPLDLLGGVGGRAARPPRRSATAARRPGCPRAARRPAGRSRPRGSLPASLAWIAAADASSRVATSAKVVPARSASRSPKEKPLPPSGVELLLEQAGRVARRDRGDHGEGAAHREVARPVGAAAQGRALARALGELGPLVVQLLPDGPGEPRVAEDDAESEQGGAVLLHAEPWRGPVAGEGEGGLERDTEARVARRRRRQHLEQAIDLGVDRLPHRLARLLAPHEARDQAAGHVHPAVGEARLPGAEGQRLDGGQDAAQVAVAPEPGDGEGREGVEEERGHGQAPHPEARLGDGEPPLLDADERRSRHVEPPPGPRDPDRGHARHAARAQAHGGARLEADRGGPGDELVELSRGEAHGAGLARRHLARVLAAEEAHQVALVGGGDRRRLGDRGLPLEGQHREGEAAEEDQCPQRGELRQEDEPGPPAPPPGEPRPDAEEDAGGGQQELERAGHREARAGAEGQERQDERDAGRRQGDAEGAARRPSRSGSASTASRPRGAKRRACRPTQTSRPLTTAQGPGGRPQVEEGRAPQEPGGHVPERRPEEGGIGQEAERRR